MSYEQRYHDAKFNLSKFYIKKRHYYRRRRRRLCTVKISIAR